MFRRIWDKLVTGVRYLVDRVKTAKWARSVALKDRDNRLPPAVRYVSYYGPPAGSYNRLSQKGRRKRARWSR